MSVEMLPHWFTFLSRFPPTDSWSKKTASYLASAQLVSEQRWLLAAGIERSTWDQWQESCIDPAVVMRLIVFAGRW